MKWEMSCVLMDVMCEMSCVSVCDVRNELCANERNELCVNM